MEILRRLTNTMDHLLLLIFSLFLFSFSWLARNVMKWKTETHQAWICVHDCIIISLRWDHTVSALRCGWLASRRLAATGCLAHNNGYKMPPFYYIVRSTRQLTLKITSSLPSETCNGSSTNIWILGQLWRARKPFSQKHRCGWWMDLNSNALICNGNVKWFEISLLHN